MSTRKWVLVVSRRNSSYRYCSCSQHAPWHFLYTLFVFLKWFRTSIHRAGNKFDLLCIVVDGAEVGACHKGTTVKIISRIRATYSYFLGEHGTSLINQKELHGIKNKILININISVYILIILHQIYNLLHIMNVHIVNKILF